MQARVKDQMRRPEKFFREQRDVKMDEELIREAEMRRGALLAEELI